MEIGKKIKDERKKKNITQKQLGEYLSVTQQAVAKWESGNAEPDTKALNKMAELFNVTVDYLLGRDTPQYEEITEQELLSLGFSKEKVEKMTEKDFELLDKLTEKDFELLRAYAQALLDSKK